MTHLPVAIDGRSARAARTRSAVVVAILDLIGEGNLRPTARHVSDRAGVSLRSVFQHFSDLESLFAAAADLQIARVTAAAGEVPVEGSLAARIDAFVEARAATLEAITPVRRAALLQEPFSAEIAARLAWARQWARDQVERAFAPELDRMSQRARWEITSALHAATEWYTWETLRTHEHLSLDSAKRVMSRTIRALLQKEE